VASYRFRLIKLRTSIDHDLIPESIHSLSKLPAQTVLWQLVQFLKFLFVVDWLHQRETLPIGEIRHDRFLYLS